MELLMEIEDRLSKVEEKNQQLEIEIDKLFKEIEELKRTRVRTRIIDIERKIQLITIDIEDASKELNELKSQAFRPNATKGICNPGVIA